MQLVRDIYAAKRAAGKPVISFEFFPPKTDEGDRALLEKTIPTLKQTRPDYCSVTYGAGGGTREKTLMIVDRIQKEQGLVAVAHLTCVCSTKDEIRALLGQIQALGVRNVLALAASSRSHPADSSFPASSSSSSATSTSSASASPVSLKDTSRAKRASSWIGNT